MNGEKNQRKMAEQKRKCVVIGILVFIIIAAIIGVLCGIFIPKILQKHSKESVIINPGE